MQRRHFLKLAGGGIVLGATAAATFAATRTPTMAIAPWQAAGTYKDPRKFALSYAILAPNPHNRQPWEVALIGDDQILIHRDKSKNLPFTDPFDRQLTIGMGCFLELLAIAASARGFTTDTTLFPQGYDGPVALVRLRPGAKKDALFDQILDRRSCKEPYDMRPLPTAAISALSPFAEIITDDTRTDDLRDLTWQAFMVEYETPATQKESVDLMRFGKAAINASPDGIAMGGAMMECLYRLGIFTPETALDASSIAYKQGIEMFRDILHQTPHYAMITTDRNDRHAQVTAGQQWLRLNLTATGLGLALHPVSQALQEYDEMRPLYTRIHKSYAEDGHTIQMLGRLGYGPQVPPAPRWKLEAKLANA